MLGPFVYVFFILAMEVSLGVVSNGTDDGVGAITLRYSLNRAAPNVKSGRTYVKRGLERA